MGKTKAKSAADSVRKGWHHRFTKAGFKRLGWLALFISLFAASLPLLDYVRQDTTVSDPGELWLLVVFFILTGVILLASYSLWLKTNTERLIASMGATYWLGVRGADFANQSHFLQSHFNSKVAILIVEVAGYLMAGLLALAFDRVERYIEAKKWTDANPLETIAKFVCVALLLFNGFKLVNYLSTHHVANGYQPGKTVSAKLKQPTQAPDIYYFVFDRYASQTSLAQHFNFDNTAFINQLKAEGFSVRDDAYSNYQYTAPSVASTLRMDYHADLDKALPGKQPNNFLPYKKLFTDNNAASLLRQAGYQTVNFGNWWNVTRKQKQATNILPQYQLTVLGKQHILSELQANGLARSFFGIVLKYIPQVAGKTVLKFSFSSPRELYLGQLAEVKQLAQQPHTQPRFVFGHFLNAHPPYLFLPDGSPSSYNSGDSNAGIPRREKYVNQLQFANSSSIELIKSIKAASKTPPIIIIQADEGPYPVEPVKDWVTAPADTVKLKMGILAAYYLPGLPTGSQPNSSVNAFRYVFNQYFGANIKELPDCSFVSNGDTPFKFVDVTTKLHSSNANCTPYK